MNARLPIALTSFVGRRDDIRAVREQLRERRLVTLTGPGGSGKTRLAVEVCAGLQDYGPDDICWVDLATVTDSEQVPQVVATQLNVLVDPGSDPLQAMLRAMRPRRLLLCLDTCEHLLDAVAALTGEVMQSCSGMSILATSREPLGVAGEAMWPVPPLGEQDAYQLFVDRAVLVAPWFSAADQAEQVLAVCRRVDGIPLAVELAAAWVRALSPMQILSGIEKSLRLLAAGPRGTVPRHQTIAASLDWSHDLLDEVERVVFRRLSVFISGFTLDAVAAVCWPVGTSGASGVDVGEAVAEPEVLAVLGRLVDKSLVTLLRGSSEVRYRLLDTIRQYAGEELQAAGEVNEVRDRHLSYYVALAELADSEFDRDQDAVRERVAGHRDDIVTAVRWGLATPEREELSRRLCAAMARLWALLGYVREEFELLRRAASRVAHERSSIDAQLLSGMSMLAMVTGQRNQCVELANLGLQIAVEVQDARTRARCLSMLAYGEFFVDPRRCHALGTEASAAGAQIEDVFSRDWGTALTALSLTRRDRHDEALALARAASESSRLRHDRWIAAFAGTVETYAALHCGDVRAAMSIASDVLATVEPLRDTFVGVSCAVNVTMALAMGGDLDGAHRVIEPIVNAMVQAPEVDAVGLSAVVGHLRLWSGEITEALAWFERGTGSRRIARDGWTVTRCYPGFVGSLRRTGRLLEASEHAERAISLARECDAPYVLAAVLDESGYLAAETDFVRAAALHHEALTVRRAAGLNTFLADSLDALALVALRAERFAEAARLFGTGDEARADMGYPRPPIDEASHQVAIAALRTALGDDGFATATEEGTALSIDDALTVASRGRGQRDRPHAGWDSLTPTEREVVRFVVAGLTNPEIARRMFVSRATVKTHLSHIYAKLNLTNRTGLAALATRHGYGPATGEVRA